MFIINYTLKPMKNKKKKIKNFVFIYSSTLIYIFITKQ